MNFVDMILFNATHSPEKIAIAAEQAALSYGQLGQGILAAQRKLESIGLQPGNLAGVHIKHPIDHIVLTCALHRLGVGSMPIDSIPQATTDVPQLSLVLTDRILPPDMLKRFPATILLFDPSWFKEQTSIGPGRRGVPDIDAAWTARVFVDADSADGKIVGISAGAFVAQLGHYHMSTHARWDRMVTTMSLHTNPGYLLPLMALWLGRMVCFASPDTARELAILHGHDYLVTSQRHAERLETLQRESYRSIQSLRGAYILGRSFTSDQVRRAQSALCGNIVCGHATPADGVIAFAPAACFSGDQPTAGLLAPWAEVEVRDADGKPVNGAAMTGSVVARLKKADVHGGVHGGVHAGEHRAEHGHEHAAKDRPWTGVGRAGNVREDGMIALVP